jgi:CRISPR system Cascade subunit CasD
MSEQPLSVVLRFAGPLQSWGVQSRFNRRETAPEPTKSGVVGWRSDSIDDLLALQIAVRTDRPGTLLRDYHTVSDYRGRPLLSASVDAKGAQRTTTPKKYTHVTERFYLQDAVFVVAVGGDPTLVRELPGALRRPKFPLFLGRRSCVPTMPILLESRSGFTATGDAGIFDCGPLEALSLVKWQIGTAHSGEVPSLKHSDQTRYVELPVTIDDASGDDIASDLPISFDPPRRALTDRRVRHVLVRVEVPSQAAQQADRSSDSIFEQARDPFKLMDW